ncbi:cytochrome c3 family protein [Candidatus Magnetaquicoccus inordinatus]|uniref:cytochrome c3 family protein n=1 Tax=Candidatus Magnetaquicoccus inordinatus TaxID=2496818 RepID=UPI00187D16F7|nr:cytochrome c3 family protein [Candidatus Magnetaquicoccus inordinatus]
MKRTTTILLWINLGVLVVLVLVYPHLMISPGALLKGHAELESDCFACHAPLFGISDGKCVSCHKVHAIGVTTTKNIPLSEKKSKIPFHQKLLGEDCVACHSDHAGVAKFRVKGRFSHQLLEEKTRMQCISCHQRPNDQIHRPLSAQCDRCHSFRNWQTATFEHDKYFSFDKDHHVQCAVCHTGEDYKKYTCYGCHKHSTEKIRKKHLKKGINDYERCVLCHRNANEHDAKELWRSGRWREGLSGAAVQGGEQGIRPKREGEHVVAPDDRQKHQHKRQRGEEESD